MSLQQKPVQTKEEIQTAAGLAAEIWREHYTPLLGRAQVDYMLEKFLSPDSIAGQIAKGTCYVLTLADGRPVGFCAYAPEEGRMFLSKIYLRREARGQGLARKLLTLVEQKAKERGLLAVYLTVNKENAGAIAAYRAMGFQTVDAVKTPIGSGYFMDDYIMEKAILP